MADGRRKLGNYISAVGTLCHYQCCTVIFGSDTREAWTRAGEAIGRRARACGSCGILPSRQNDTPLDALEEQLTALHGISEVPSDQAWPAWQESPGQPSR